MRIGHSWRRGLPRPQQTVTLAGVSVRIAFEGGPADGTVEDYTYLSTALPSLYWPRDEPERVGAVYRRLTDAPDPVTGTWRYCVVD